MKKAIRLIPTFIIMVIALAGCSTSNSPVQANSQQTNTPTQNQTSTDNNTQSRSITPSTPNSATPNSQAGTPNLQRSIKTPRGVVWNPSPSMNSNGSAVPSLLTPFSLYLSPNNTKRLQISSAEKILTLPLTENTSAGEFFVYLNNYFYSGNWIVYSIHLMKPGMAQPYINQLRAVSLDDKRDILVTSFRDAGGNFFAVGSDNNLILVSQKSPGPGVTYFKQVKIFNLSNGQTESVDTKNLKVIPEKSIVEYSKDGQPLTFQLQLSSSIDAFE